MSTQGVGTFAINSFWESGRLIYYEKAYGHTTTGNVFILGADYVQVGDTANDVNFVWKGSSTGTFTLDAGAHTLALTGMATSTNGAVTMTSAGINIEGTVTLALGIGSTTALTTVTTATSAVKVQSNFTGLTTTYHIANYFISQYTAAGTGSLRTVVGQVDLSGTQTTASTAQYLVGVHGRAKVTGTAYNTALCVTGVHGQILDGGTWTAANHISAVWADWQLNNDFSAASSSELIYLSNNANNATYNPTNVMYIYAPYVTYLFNLNSATNGGMVSTGTSTGTAVQVKCAIDGTAYYINMYPTAG